MDPILLVKRVTSFQSEIILRPWCHDVFNDLTGLFANSSIITASCSVAMFVTMTADDSYVGWDGCNCWCITSESPPTWSRQLVTSQQRSHIISLLFMNTIRSLTTWVEEQVHRCGGQNNKMMIILQCRQIPLCGCRPCFPLAVFLLHVLWWKHHVHATLFFFFFYRQTACDCCDVKVLIQSLMISVASP